MSQSEKECSSPKNNPDFNDISEIGEEQNDTQSSSLKNIMNPYQKSKFKRIQKKTSKVRTEEVDFKAFEKDAHLF